MTDARLTIPDIAARVGVKPVTIRVYLHRGQMPPPTGRLGRTPWWSAETIEQWISERKGK
jgi:predicted DNA-binding transcriptional regulator AlpA